MQLYFFIVLIYFLDNFTLSIIPSVTIYFKISAAAFIFLLWRVRKFLD